MPRRQPRKHGLRLQLAGCIAARKGAHFDSLPRLDMSRIEAGGLSKLAIAFIGSPGSAQTQAKLIAAARRFGVGPDEV